MEVVLSLGIIGIVFAGIIGTYVHTSYRAEWSGYSLAAQAQAIQQLEQAKSAVWDVSAGGGFGTLFRGSPSGVLTTLFGFGEFYYYPGIWSGVMEARDGSLYGMNMRDASFYRVTGVNLAPAITVPPATQILRRGAPASLSAGVNTTGLSCQWLP